MSTYDDAMDTTPDKGKGKLQEDTVANPAVEEESSEEEEEETFDEHVLPEDEVEHDALEEITSSNIVPGGRTRGKAINYAEVDQTGLDDDDDDDEDFQEKPAPEDEDVDRMED
ncbi:hypothetical protein TWF225_004112 [Orbilia oligospora]|uniref:Uncharacterized protein n=1 Tax=Orbilia oligospora TaxID=2813651 RepID=A0A7C8P219_ORBOL|nr:hypothetical protein TWF751_005219 [Orbilia oligospora]KAF3159992.1 hypothetical protein TWF225_004112 [Orbilia oligospora]KAF3235611.1 hypothetical protein TWF128_001804 [Orbilia oligospora]KAF3238248.1 hypothetical protein TWF217_001741 [Orbilia oligospora]KAF3273946.1 hypothetical protein TWF132_004479 [Orbilia oligospora]